MLTQTDYFAKRHFAQEYVNGDIWITVPRCGLQSTRDFTGQNQVLEVLAADGQQGVVSLDYVYDRQEAGQRVIMCVRDPIERIQSAYNYTWIWRDSMTFEEFVEGIAALSDEDVDMHMKSQHYYRVTETGRVIVPDHYVRTDRLTADLENFRVGYRGQIKRLNVSNRRKPDVTSRLTGVINSRYSSDQQMWNAANL
jgi:hypothetical protein